MLVVASEDKKSCQTYSVYTSFDKWAVVIFFYYPELLPCLLGPVSAPQCAAAVIAMLNRYL